MRRAIPVLVGSAAVMLALAVPALHLHVTAGDNRGIPAGTQATEGLFVLQRTLGRGALAPNQILVDTGRPGGALSPGVVAAQRRLVAMLRADRAVDPSSVVAPVGIPAARAHQAGLLDPSGRIAQIRAAGYSDSGTQAAVDLVHRIRDRYVPAG
jgi:uncharacterized membrane protein YdfJ with MMPL/SSD domain